MVSVPFIIEIPPHLHTDRREKGEETESDRRSVKKIKMEKETDLVRLCLEAACKSKESVEKWPSQGELSNACLLTLRNLSFSASSIAASSFLPCSRMTNLKEVDLSRCMKVTDAGVSHLVSISTLEKLWI
ncbi:hypothetical protein SLEP1_g40397 [Rubroshorea leprosula]|uniref:Uncharacterized protein n=1 Tax=Rubroshorea leprosula TaxID=152421 RepID=A0AAV5L3F4_9ROSI|nr:hypothetical protein SLEP1_g40397 [Rubroshorea leprosula]